MNFRKLFTFNNKNYRRFKNYDDEYRSSIDEIVIHSNQHDCQPSTSVTRVSNIPESVDNLTSCLQASNIKTLLNNTNKVLVLKFQTSSKPTLAELNEVSQQCLKKSIVILLTSDDERNFFLYWKSKDLGHFLTFKIYDRFEFMNDVKFFEFLTNFLGCSLNRGHLGLHSGASTNSGPTIIQLHHLADHRDYNLLLVAAEVGNAYIVQLMLTLGFSSEFREVNAQTLAWKNRHFEVLSLLLKSNLIYPYTIYIDECPNDIQEFYEISRRLNEAIMLRDQVTVLRILTQNPQIIHFYNLNNESAPAFALKRRYFDMYKLLISKNILLGPHEKFSDIIEDMKEADREKLREIHYVGSQNLPDNHMHVLMSNSRLGHDTSDSTKKYEIIQKAFETMNQNRFVQIILMIVAASRNFRIIFDFNRDSVEVVDPTADESTDGLFYSENGRIYIGAKKLLDEKTRLDALGVMAHEFCHYVMCLVYKNCGNPYGCGDKQGEQEFKDISTMCLDNAGKERVVDVVHECYPFCVHHAELVVRVPHLIMKYFNNPERFGVVRVIYGKLFDAFECRIYKDLQEALPRIEANAETEKEKSKRKIRKLRTISVLVGLLAVVGILCGVFAARFYFYKPALKFSSLSKEDQTKVKNASVIFKNVNIMFHDLFPGNSSVYEMLTSEDIYQMLGNIPMNFSDPHYIYLDKLVAFSWGNLTEKLKTKFLTSNWSFQGETLSYKLLNESHPAVLNSLSSGQIIEVLDDKILFVHNMTKNGTQFYVERKIFIEYIYEIYFLFMLRLHHNYQNIFCKFENLTGTANDTFENFYNDFMNLDYLTRMQQVEEITNYNGFRSCTPNDFRIYDSKTKTITETLFDHKNLQISFKDLLNVSIPNYKSWSDLSNNHTRLFDITADSFAETTVTFQSFPFSIKADYPTRWIMYLDFRFYSQFDEHFEKLEEVEKVLEQVQGLNSNNEFEKAIFKDFFNSGNVIFFWDGFDQMYSYINSGMLGAIQLINNYTQNFQFISTSSFFSNRYRNMFKIKTFSFVPFDEGNRERFLNEYFKVQNLNQSMIPIYTQKVQKILNGTDLKQDLNTPVMLEMIGYTILNDIEAFELENIYKIYEKYAEIKVKSAVNGSEFMDEFLAQSLISGFNVIKYYQKFALMSYDVTHKGLFAALKLKAATMNLPKLSKLDEISKMGILNIKSQNIYKFVHPTFAEYFTAQYLIENIYNADFEIPEQEAEMRIKILYFSSLYSRIFSLMKSYFQAINSNKSKNFNFQISTLLSTKYQNFLLNFMKISEGTFTPLLEFFGKNQQFLVNLLQPNKSVSLYRATYDYTYLKFFTYLSIDRTEIKEFARKHLTNEEYSNFISIKDLKGTILYSLYCIKQFTNSSEKARNFIPGYDLPEDVFESLNGAGVVEAISKNLTINEYKVLLSSNSLFYPLIVFLSYSGDVAILINHLPYFEDLWDLIDKTLSSDEQKDWLKGKLKLIFLQTGNVMEYFIDKIQFFLTSSEIYEIFVDENILHSSVAFGFFENFYYSWSFIMNHTTWKQQRDFLQNNVEIECYLDSRYNDYCYYVPKINILQASLVQGLVGGHDESLVTFSGLSKIYKVYFANFELQDLIIKGSKDFIPFIVNQKQFDKCKIYAEFLKNIFKGNEKLLKEFLLAEVEPTKLNIFELLVNVNYVKDCIKIFKELIN